MSTRHYTMLEHDADVAVELITEGFLTAAVTADTLRGQLLYRPAGDGDRSLRHRLKAATMHMLELIEEDEGLRCRVVFDV